MSYGLAEYAAGLYGGSRVQAPPSADTRTALSIEVAFTTDALATPVWEDITSDVRFWDVSRGRSRELEPFQPGRATIVLSNLSRQYDAVYAAGLHFGDLRPMRRVRIRETFNGVTYPVFDGFVDRWQLDYPAVGKDATATLTATDAVKVFARTDLPPSVYQSEVAADDPQVWLRLDDEQTIVDDTEIILNSGDNGFNATVPTGAGQQFFGAQGLIAQDPGTAVEFDERAIESMQIPLNTTVLDGSWTVECWIRLREAPTATNMIWAARGGGTNAVTLQINSVTKKLGLVYTNSAGSSFSAQPSTALNVGQRYHIVATHAADRILRIFVDGAEGAYDTQQTTSGTLSCDAFYAGSEGTFASLKGFLDEVAVYGDNVLSSTRITAHYDAGSHPWQGDGPDDRLGRILDLAEWPALLREIDAGAATFQSANLEGQTVLDHAQKVADTEFGLLFISRDGKVRFVDRASQAARTPGPTVYGDGAGEVGYRSIRPDDGDEVIRNSATISRYNGVAKTATGATIDEFGRFQYTLDGLLHDSDSYSSSYAQFIVDEYEEPRRRIVELTVGPPKDGSEALFYPAMLGPEIGDAISVTHTPQGLGDAFEQVCVVEGIMHQSAPGRNRTTTFILSPEFTQTLF